MPEKMCGGGYCSIVCNRAVLPWKVVEVHTVAGAIVTLKANAHQDVLTHDKRAASIIFYVSTHTEGSGDHCNTWPRSTIPLCWIQAWQRWGNHKLLAFCWNTDGSLHCDRQTKHCRLCWEEWEVQQKETTSVSVWAGKLLSVATLLLTCKKQGIYAPA